MRRFFTTLLTALLLTTSLRAQDNLTQMTVELPQAMILNPAQTPTHSFITVPLIGGATISAYNSFCINDVITEIKGRNVISIKSLILASLSNGNSFYSTINADILNAGYRLSDKDYIGLSVRGRAVATTTYPLGALEFLSDNSIYADRVFNVSLEPDILGWCEFGASYSRTFGNFTVGVRMKYLAGFIGAQSEDGASFEINKVDDGYTINGNYNLSVGGIYSINDNLSTSQGGSCFDNSGFATDLGVNYLSNNNRLRISLSASDIGFIDWTGASTITAKNPYKDYIIDDLGSILSSGASIRTIIDSLVTYVDSTIGFDVNQGETYRSTLPLTLLATTSYSLGAKLQHTLSLGYIGIIPSYRSVYNKASLGYSYRSPNNVWQLMCNYTYITNYPLNVGLGVVMTTGCYQLYLATENIISPFSISNARTADLRIGMNFSF